jgi:hypothetical protein
MKEQYVGDINDYRKYALLRVLAGEGETTIGVCWMLTPPDGRSDGNKIDYLQCPEDSAQFDPPLFKLLSSVTTKPDRRRLIEKSGILPRATFFNRPLSDAFDERHRYFEEAGATLANCDLVFFDPDNGIEVQGTPKGRKDSARYIYWDEIATFYGVGQSILVYQHYSRKKREDFINRLGAHFLDAAPDATLWAFRTAHVVFLLAVHPRHRESLSMQATQAENRWPPEFISGGRI